MTSNHDALSSILQDLHAFSDPRNSKGFIITFYEWVIREWTARPYYMTEIASFGCDFTNYPQRTDFQLSEKAKTYRDFIHANNGHHYAAFHSGQGSACETLEKNLYEFFHESMRLRAIHFLAKTYPDLDGDVFWNQIFCEDFSQERELTVVEDIHNHFGFYGLAVEPYTCPHGDPNPTDMQRYSHWTLKDFESQLQRLKSLEAPRPKIIIRNQENSRPFRVEPLTGKAYKKNLSQSGAFA